MIKSLIQKQEKGLVALEDVFVGIKSSLAKFAKEATEAIMCRRVELRVTECSIINTEVCLKSTLWICFTLLF